jgi:hypothetical protein
LKVVKLNIHKIFGNYIMYRILPRVHDNAKELGVTVHPSDNPKYKIEVYDSDGVFMFYLGAAGYGDYPTYIHEDGKPYADERRRLYRIRHAKEIAKVQSRGWFAWKLLWC